MAPSFMTSPGPPDNPFNGWDSLAGRVLDGHALSREEGLSVLDAPDDELLALLAAAYRVRSRRFGNQVQLYFLTNAKKLL